MIELGHIAYYVSQLEQSLKFYHEALGLKVVGKLFDGRAAMLTGGRTHHELLLIEVGDNAASSARRLIGTYHVAWKVGQSLQELKDMKQKLSSLDYPIQAVSDHTISQSLYLHDPDGNQVELYVDDPQVDWSKDTSWMQEPVKPLHL